MKMKALKRNAVIVTVLLFMCAAVYLNWSYNEKTKDAANAGTGDKDKVETSGDVNKPDDAAPPANEGEGAGLFYEGDPEPVKTADPTAEYFAQVRLERQQAREDAAATLQTVASAEGAAQETVDKALADMSQLAAWAVKEAELENLIRAKGFTDCVVYLSDDGATVTVAAKGGLSEPLVARITDVIVSETEITPENLKVIEIK